MPAATDETTAGAETSRGRRWLLGAGGALVAGATLAPPGVAEAAVTGARVRKVTKLVAIRWKYDKKTHKTTVTKARRTKVQARFVGKQVYERNASGRWRQIPYRWSSKRKALVYDRRLHLKLLGPPPKKPDAKPPTTPKPPPGPTHIAKTATAVSPYVTTSMAWHLARRATYGPSPALIAEIERLGADAWLEQQLQPTRITDRLCDSVLAQLGKPGTEMLPLGTPIRVVNDALEDGSYRGAEVNHWQQKQLAVRAHIARALWSRRQLLTVMEDFWGNHFNVPYFVDDIAPSREHLAATIRSRALGKFSDLLTAVTTHPAMLTYLNNRDSDKDHPNENLGRELLELHTVGVGSAYGEAGVVNSARILTGLSVNSDSEEFYYKDWKHWTGQVTVLGFKDANASANGLEVAKRYLNYLAHHPDTARHVCRKLAVRFVSDAPPAALVESLAAVYLRSDTEIAPVLRSLFGSKEFAASAGAKLHRPFERLVASVRLLEFLPGPDLAETADAMGNLQGWCEDAGHAPFGWAAPNGYPDVAAAWLSTGATLQSWNARINTLLGWWPSRERFSDNDLTKLLPYSVKPWKFPSGYTHGDLVQDVARRLLGRSLPADHVDAVCTFLATRATKALKEGAGAVDDWQLGNWVTLLLDSPYGLVR